MNLHPLAGEKAPESLLTDIPRLMTAYYTQQPDPESPEQRVAFGTSGHRGVSTRQSFNESHILAIVQAICDHRRQADIEGPLFLGKDTHALSEAAFLTALEVLAANGVTTVIQEGLGYTPTPVISHAILTHNAAGTRGTADGLVITPSHNPPDSGGIKYNPPHGGPADTDVTGAIAARANAYLRGNLAGVKQIPVARALAAATTHRRDYVRGYVEAFDQVVDMEAIRASNLRIGADAMGGAGLGFWLPLAERYGLQIELLNGTVDPTFRFMHVDRDGKIRMDCSSPYAMAGLIYLKARYDIAFGNDPDFDRHGIVTRSVGLLNPNHYLAVAIDYLFRHRTDWPANAGVGKTLVSSSLIDRVAEGLGRRLVEVPVGFKYFVDGLLHGTLGFGGEESAGASFLRRDGGPWSTDKDGLILAMLAAEMTAVTGKDPGERYAELTAQYGAPVYDRIDAPADAAQRARLARLSPEQVTATTLAGDPVTACLTRAPGNNEPIGGLKVTTARGWFAARPSGTEDVYKIYAESFRGEKHLRQLQAEAQAIVTASLAGGEEPGGRND